MKTCAVAVLAWTLALVAAAGAFAQSNDMLDAILDQKAVTVGAAGYLLLASAGRIADNATPEEAAALLREEPWWKSQKAAGDAITLGEFCHALMRIHGLRGGIFYSVFPGSRYAAREIAFRGFVPADPSPYRRLPGDEAIHILRSYLETREAAE